MRFSTKVLTLLLAAVAAGAAFPARGAGDAGRPHDERAAVAEEAGTRSAGRRGLARLLPASWECNRSHDQTIDLSIQRKTGEVIKGPAKIVVPVNRLRYDATMGSEVVVGSAPEFGPLSFIPALPGMVKTQAAAAAKKDSPSGMAAVAAAAATASETAGTPPDARALDDATERLNFDLTQARIEALPDAFAAAARQEQYERQLERLGEELGRRPVQGIVSFALSAQSGPAMTIPIADADLVELIVTRLEAELVRGEAELESLRNAADAVKRTLEGERDTLQATVRASNQLLRDDRRKDLLDQIDSVRRRIDRALATTWPGTTDLSDRLDSIAIELGQLIRVAGFSEWLRRCDLARAICNWERLESAELDLDALVGGVAKYAKGAELEKAQAALRADLRGWLPHLRSLSENSFQIVHQVDCGFPYFASRTTKLHVVLVDRLETDKSKATQTVQVAEVQCPSHFSVTAGVGVALIDERDFDFVEAPAPPPPPPPSTTPPSPPPAVPDDGDGLTKVFGFNNRSSEQINPTFLISTRLVQCQTADLNLSFGTVLDLDRPDSSAVFGYLGGLTLSVKDQLFMTLGVQAQRVPELAGGFEIGQEVPPDLTAPPLEANWDFGPVLSVTYKVN